ncbi:MAG: multicopper oxidase domain-containing protein, partial [Chloroflexia bacterium]
MKIRKVLIYGAIGIFVLIAGVITFIAVSRPQKNLYPNAQLAITNKLAIPPLLTPRMENGEKVFDLTVEKGETEFLPGKSTATFGFNGSYLGPTIRASTNDKVRINVTNKLGVATSVHWHGMHLPAAMDGGPHQIIEDGAEWQPNWTVTNEAATLWYHPHLMGNTGEQVYRGLAGLFIIDDANSTALDLPHEYGVDDIPLVIHDRKFDANGQFIYDQHSAGSTKPSPAGMIGDTILVNGTIAPYVEAPKKMVRFRLVNSSNGRRYNFGFTDDHPFYAIATDGGLLNAPIEVSRILLASGERAEIVVDLSDTTGPLMLMSYGVPDSGNPLLNFISGFFGEDDTNQQFKILEVRPQAGNYAVQTIPQKLNTIVKLDESAAANVRRFRLDSRTINDNTLDHSRVDIVVKKGATEVWEIENQAPFYHSF